MSDGYKILDAVGLKHFAVGQAPASDALTDVSSEILAADADRAWAVVTLISISAGNAFLAHNATAVGGTGRLLVLGVGVEFFGPEAITGICGTGAATAVLSVQDYKLGPVRIASVT